MCGPKAIGGMGIINMKIWNRAAVAKLCWDLAQKEDKLWIRWIHNYYIKNQRNWGNPKQVSWMCRKIMSAKEIVEQLQTTGVKAGSKIKQIYLQMIGEQPRVQWKCLMYQNAARPKAYFIMWIMLNKRLLTANRLEKWRYEVAKTCVLCQKEEETNDHLFIECNFACMLWNKLLGWNQEQHFIPTNRIQFIEWHSAWKGEIYSSSDFQNHPD